MGELVKFANGSSSSRYAGGGEARAERNISTRVLLRLRVCCRSLLPAGASEASTAAGPVTGLASGPDSSSLPSVGNATCTLSMEGNDAEVGERAPTALCARERCLACVGMLA